MGLIAESAVRCGFSESQRGSTASERHEALEAQDRAQRCRAVSEGVVASTLELARSQCRRVGEIADIPRMLGQCGANVVDHRIVPETRACPTPDSALENGDLSVVFGILQAVQQYSFGACVGYIAEIGARIPKLGRRGSQHGRCRSRAESNTHGACSGRKSKGPRSGFGATDAYADATYPQHVHAGIGHEEVFTFCTRRPAAHQDVREIRGDRLWCVPTHDKSLSSGTDTKATSVDRAEAVSEPPDGFDVFRFCGIGFEFGSQTENGRVDHTRLFVVGTPDVSDQVIT